MTNDNEKRNWEDLSGDIEKIQRIRGKSKIKDKSGSTHACRGIGLLFDALGLFGVNSMIEGKIRESKERREKKSKTNER